MVAGCVGGGCSWVVEMGGGDVDFPFEVGKDEKADITEEVDDCTFVLWGAHHGDTVEGDEEMQSVVEELHSPFRFF